MFQPGEHVFDEKAKRELLGQRIELERRRKGLSQMELLRRSGLIQEDPSTRKGVKGVTVGFLTYIERGARGITHEQLKVVAKALGHPLKRFTSNEPLTRAETQELLKLRAEEEAKKPARRKTKPAVEPKATTRKRVLVKTPATRKKKVATEPRVIVSELTAADRKILAAVQRLDETQKLFLVPTMEKLVERFSERMGAAPTAAH